MNLRTGLVIAFASSALIGCAQSYCDCAIVPSSVTFTVQSAADGQRVAAPTFVEDGTPLPAVCVGSGTPDAGGVCPAWRIELEGQHVIAIDAPGLQSQSVTVDIASPGAGCCPHGEQVMRAVVLTPS